MEKIKLSEFTIEKIKNREFEKVVPELYELEEIIENNLWHNNDPVFNHVISVLTELNKLFEEVNDKIKAYLAEKIKNYSRKDLLFIAAIFHDISKKETLKGNNKITECIEHEKMGAEKLRSILLRLDLTEEEKERVIKIVRNHGFIHYNFGYLEKWEEFKIRNTDIFLDIALLAKTDILGSQLKQNDPKEFKLRIDFVNKIIDSY